MIECLAILRNVGLLHMHVHVVTERGADRVRWSFEKSKGEEVRGREKEEENKEGLAKNRTKSCDAHNAL